jgi:hypothetical protein
LVILEYSSGGAPLRLFRYIIYSPFLRCFVDEQPERKKIETMAIKM